MYIYLNEKQIELDDNISVSGLLEKQNITNTAGMAIALNGKVVRKANWDATILSDGDKILIISAGQGG
jgi:sulfur carrier protein